MQELLDQARALGSAIAQHDRMTRFVEAEAAVRKDPEASRLLDEHRKHVDKVGELEKEGKPIEPADKQRLKALQDSLSGSEPIKALIAAQADYIEMMQEVYKAVQQPISERGAAHHAHEEK